MRPWLAVPLLLAAGCPASDEALCEQLSESPMTLRIGTGRTAWQAVPADGDVPFERGEQGGLHAFGSLTADGIHPGNPDSFQDPKNPKVDFTLRASDGTFQGGYLGLPRLLEPVDGGLGFVGDLLVLDKLANEWAEVDGHPAVLEARVTDACNRQAVASTEAILRYEPPDEPVDSGGSDTDDSGAP